MEFDVQSGRIIIPPEKQITIDKLDKLLSGRADIKSENILEEDNDDIPT